MMKTQEIIEPEEIADRLPMNCRCESCNRFALQTPDSEVIRVVKTTSENSIRTFVHLMPIVLDCLSHFPVMPGPTKLREIGWKVVDRKYYRLVTVERMNELRNLKGCKIRIRGRALKDLGGRRNSRLKRAEILLLNNSNFEIWEERPYDELTDTLKKYWIDNDTSSS